MKVHKRTFGELDQPGSIWAAVTDASGEHSLMMRFLAKGQHACADECRKRRDTSLRTIRIIARGFTAECTRRDNAVKFKAAARAAKSGTCRVPGFPWTFRCGVCQACLAAKAAANLAETIVIDDPVRLDVQAVDPATGKAMKGTFETPTPRTVFDGGAVDLVGVPAGSAPPLRINWETAA